mgnify:CR=1 FL=1
MNQERILKVLVAPHISEKAAMAGDIANTFVFKVVPSANKLEIKRAVELLFKVKVDAVQVSNLKGKVKRNRYGESRRAGVKKAYVRLAEGHDIDFALAE